MDGMIGPLKKAIRTHTHTDKVDLGLIAHPLNMFVAVDFLVSATPW